MSNKPRSRRRFHISNADLFDCITELCAPGEILPPKTLVAFGATESQAGLMLDFLTRHRVLYVGSIGAQKDKHVVRTQGPMGGSKHYDADVLASIRKELE